MLDNPKWYAPLEAPAAIPALAPWQRAIAAAITYIETHGWCQWRNQDEYGQSCITGALYYGNDRDWCWSARAKIEDCVGGRLEAWNNKPGRTQEQVLTLLRAVLRGR
jgi:hypothetical protein